MDKWDQLKILQAPEVSIEKDKISIGVFSPYSQVGHHLPLLSYDDAKTLYKALRKTLIQYKRCTNKS